MSNKKNRIVIFSMDDPEITYLFFHSLIQSNIEIHKVFFFRKSKNKYKKTNLNICFIWDKFLLIFYKIFLLEFNKGRTS